MGLIRGVARTAAIAGTATAVSNRVSRRQANKWAAQDEQQAAEQDQAETSQQQAPAQEATSSASPQHRPGRHAHPASEAWRAKGIRSVDRRGVRGPEGKDPRQLTSSFDRASRA